MRKRTFIVLILLVGILLLTLLVLRSYQTDIIHSIVVGAMVEKSEASQESRIRRAFDEAYAQSLREGNEEEYLRRLLQISQRLERTQRIDQDQLEEILNSLGEEGR